MRILTLFSSAIILASVAFSPAHAVTSQQQSDLNKLSPELRAQVEPRLGPKQTVDAVLETMLLNRLSEIHANARYFRIDRDAATVTVVRGPDDKTTVRYDPRTWIIIQ